MSASGCWNSEALSFFDYPRRKNGSALWACLGDVWGVGLMLKTFSRPYSFIWLPVRHYDDFAVKYVGDFRPAVHMARLNFIRGQLCFLQTNLVVSV